MIKNKKTSSLFFLLLISAMSYSQKISADLMLQNVNIINVAKGEVVQKKWVIIAGDRIIDVGDSQIANKYTPIKIINAKGKYIMPSLWDMHVHFGGDTLIQENKMLLPLFLAMGVTTVRDCAGDISLSVLQWKKQINEGVLQGPTIFTSGPKLEGINSIWPGDLEIKDEQGLQHALDSLQKLKVDFIKITDNALQPSLFLKSIIESRKRGWKVSGHAPVTLTLQELSNAGLSTIEHLGYILRATSKEEERITKERASGILDTKTANQQILATQDSIIGLEKIKKLAVNGTSIVPTMYGSYITTYLDKENHSKDSFLQYLGPALKRTYNWRIERAAKDDEKAIEWRHQQFETAAKLLPLIKKAGMTILAGTDCGFLNSFNYPGLGLHNELEMMVHYGLSPQAALEASIINGPAFFGLTEKYGSVEKGKKADLLLLNDNPLKDISNTKNIFALVRNGNYMDRSALNKLLSNAAEEVKKLESKEKEK